MAKERPIRLLLEGTNANGTPSGMGKRYIHQNRKGDWCCTSADGTPLALCDVIEDRNEMALRFKLEDANNAHEAVKAVREHVSRLWAKVSIVD
jgi:hypothetical protein